ncbi:putative ribonuclease H-like domain-containing protein [Tanacetum coccineum]|uniref:Ribonuclease H-like domain-containing protein n=1 Tax=Tanacetum coccineum TaxID=301880 RepID=A0ABQ5D9B4_9ASTR
MPVLKKGDYTLWSIRMEQYLTNTNYGLWEVILNGNGPISKTKDEHLVETEVPPKLLKVYLARQEKENAKEHSLLALPKGLDKAYDRFQRLISQLEVHGAPVFNEDANHKFLRALPSSWSNIALIMRNNDKLDTLDLDDLYNNLKVYEADIKDGIGYGWSYMAEEEPTDFAFMAYTSSNSGSDFEKNEDVYEEMVGVLEFGVKEKENAIIRLEKQLDKILKEKEDVKVKLEKFETSSKNLTKLLNSQLSAKDKTGLGYDVQLNENNFNNCEVVENVSESVFDSHSSDGDDIQTNDRFKKVDGYHVVPPPLTGNYIPPKADLSFVGLDDSVYKCKVSESIANESKVETNVTKTSTNSVEKPKTDRPSAPLIQKRTLILIMIVVLHLLSHLKKDYTFHEDRMAKRPMMKNNVGQGTGQRETRPVWNNAQRVNHKNKFVPSAVLTRSGKVPVSAAKQSSPREAVSTSPTRQVNTATPKKSVNGHPQHTLKDKGVVDSGCSRHMTGNKSYLTDYQDIDGGFVAFGGGSKGGMITGKGNIKIDKLDFEDVYFVKELKFNLFSVSQMCDKKNNVLFTKNECLVLSSDFKLLDESQFLLKVPRKNNMYSFDMQNVVPTGGLTCLIAKATSHESNMWHKRLGHVNFNNMNKLVRGNLVRGLPSKIFENDHSCVACQKGKQHKASYKTKLVSSISQPLQMLHIDLFGPTSIRSLNHKTYCLVVADLARCDNGTEFKNREMNEFCKSKGIKREFSNARTPQQNEVAERKNRTLIEASRTILADSLLPVTFWVETVNTACYVLNRALVTKPQNKTPYELVLGKFEGKADEGFLVRYSMNSKAFRVYNSRTRKVEEKLHIKFLENKPNVAGNGPTWLFDIDSLTNSMNYQPVTAGNQTNKNAGPQETNDNIGTQVNVDADITARKKNVPGQQYILMPLCSSGFSFSSTFKGSTDAVVDDAELAPEDSVNENNVHDLATKDDKDDHKKIAKEKEAFRNEFERRIAQEMAAKDY